MIAHLAGAALLALCVTPAMAQEGESHPTETLFRAEATIFIPGEPPMSQGMPTTTGRECIDKIAKVIEDLPPTAEAPPGTELLLSCRVRIGPMVSR